MKVLVTGGAGFIGSHLVDRLVADGHTVRVLDSFEPQVHGDTRPDYLNPSAEYLEGDVRDRQLIRQALEDVEIVFHEAAAVGVGQSMYEISRYVDANCVGTAMLLETIVTNKLPIQRFIVASSMSIYGEGLYQCQACGPVSPSLREEAQLRSGAWEPVCPSCQHVLVHAPTSEETRLDPTSVYAISKRDQEELCLIVGRSYRIPTVALRYFNVYGPRQALSNPYTGACAIFSSRIKNGNSPLVYEDGLQTRDFVDVRDIVQANLLVMIHPDAPYRVFNVGTGAQTSILQVARTLAKLYGTAIEPEVTRHYRAGDIRHCYADISQLRRLGYQPSIALEQGLQTLVSWGRTVHAEDRVEAAVKELQERGLAQGQQIEDPVAR